MHKKTQIRKIERRVLLPFQVYDACSLKVSKMEIEAEGRQYDACQFEINTMVIICRSSKITPKKIGQFVTFWKRDAKGITAPFHQDDSIDFYVVNIARPHSELEKGFGQFVFPRWELIDRGIISTGKKDGKRGFRVYPSWSHPNNKQAQKTQNWQVKYFFERPMEGCDGVDLDLVKRLYSRPLD